MSEEPPEDVKPKLNLTVNYEGQSELLSGLPVACFCHSRHAHLSAITVKVRANTNFTKIFQAAEVHCLVLIRLNW
jgi:hypothetical protein